MGEEEHDHMEHGATLESLFQAYFDCRKNKRNTMNALRFETDYESNLIALREELNSSTWHPGRSIAFVIQLVASFVIYKNTFKFNKLPQHLIL
ncbi:hypothetical protein OQJ26_17045 [Legionella sp. PATHC038]|uniref:hypothetical protein n=1 Tax=Legionella sheltonii TaxID=2992041 RepID=UPI002242EFD5|nr:hypothetical protein [Legionella sp. PATHC038]MCW8400489.1 hypothetical protein [Legionella sp. PATHC038]